jgi:Flp pilus assembly protein TadD
VEATRQVLLARDELQRCLALDPRDAKAHALLGQVLYALSDKEGARRHLQRALDLGAQGTVARATRQYLKMVGP